MNGFAAYYINEHLQSLLGEPKRHEHWIEQASMRTRIKSAVAEIRRSIAAGAASSNGLVPALKDYPYRS